MKCVISWLTAINAITQVIIIATMNTMEFILVPNLLLWGKFNSVFALLLICVVLYNEFVLNKTAFYLAPEEKGDGSLFL